MTYNFDFDAWYEREAKELTDQRRRGSITQAEFLAAMDQLQAEFEELVARQMGPADYSSR